MKSLATALKDAGQAAEPLPTVFHGLKEEGAQVRLGELTVIASAPGVGKSLVAVTLAVRAGVPTLFLSPDTSKFTVGVRVAAMLSGRTIPEVEAALRDDEIRQQYLDLFDKHTQHVRWTFEELPMPTTRDIEQEVQAFAVAWGDYPHLIVVDGLRNIFSEEDDWTAFRHNTEFLNVLARETGSAVVVLHHLVGSHDDGQHIPTQKELEGKVSKLPSMILGLFTGNFGDIGCAVLKNRFAPANAAGKQYIFFDTDMERVNIN